MNASALAEDAAAFAEEAATRDKNAEARETGAEVTRHEDNAMTTSKSPRLSQLDLTARQEAPPGVLDRR